MRRGAGFACLLERDEYRLMPPFGKLPEVALQHPAATRRELDRALRQNCDTQRVLVLLVALGLREGDV